MTFQIYLPKHLEAEIKEPPTQIEGRYSFKKYKADTNTLVQELESIPNLITNAGLVMLGTAWSARIFIGTGTSRPANGDTVLQNYINNTSATQTSWNRRSAVSPTGEWVEGSLTMRFAAGEATGNITEVGIGRVISSGTPPVYELFSRALVVDGAGNPTAITVLADEYLDVTYTLRVYSSPANNSATLVISGVNYDMVIGRYYDGASGTNPFVPSGLFNGSNSNFSAIGKSAGNLEFSGGIDSTVPFITPTLTSLDGSCPTVQEPSNYGARSDITFGLNAGNLTGGIKGFLWNRSSVGDLSKGIHSAHYRATVNPPIPKDPTKILNFGLRWSWGRKTLP